MSLLLLLLCMLLLLLLLDLRLLFACCTRLGELVRCAASLERVTRVATPTAVVVFVDVVIATVVVVATVAGFLATISLILPLLLLLLILLSPLPVAPPGSSLRTDCRVPVAGEARLLVSFSLGLNGSAVSAGAILVRRYCQTYPGCITGTRGPLSD